MKAKGVVLSAVEGPGFDGQVIDVKFEPSGFVTRLAAAKGEFKRGDKVKIVIKKDNA